MIVYIISMELRVKKNDSVSSKSKAHCVLLSPTRKVSSVFTLFAWAFAYSLVYIVFPVLNSNGNTNYWAYALAKQQWWAIFTNAAYVEIADTCIPGATDEVYVGTYVCGVFSIPSITLLFWVCGLLNNNAVQLLTIGAPIISTGIGFGYYHFYLADHRKVYSKYERVRESNKLVVFDLLSMVHNINNDAIVEPKDRTKTYVLWMDTVEELLNCDCPQPEENVKNPVLEDEVTDVENMQIEPSAGFVGSPSLERIQCCNGFFEAMVEFCKAYALLPRYWNSQNVPWAEITSDTPRLHYVCAISFLIGWILCYFSLMEFSSLFRRSPKSDRFKWFVAFSVASTLLKFIMKRLGLFIDQGKIGTTSVYFVAEFMLTLFYFVFYRMLFEEFIGWEMFILVQVFHFALEWVVYLLRSTEWYFNLWHALPHCGAFISVQYTLRDWQVFLSLDLAMRMMVICISGPVFMLLLLATAECYWVKSDLKPVSLEQFGYVCLQISLCILLEVINGFIMYRCYYERERLELLSYFINCFSNQRFRIICFLIATCQFINPFVVFEGYQT